MLAELVFHEYHQYQVMTEKKFASNSYNDEVIYPLNYIASASFQLNSDIFSILISRELMFICC